MKLTPELAERLKQNLIFSNDDGRKPTGAVTILFRDENQESMTELYRVLHGIMANADKLIDMEFDLPEFAADVRTEESAPESAAAE